MDRPPDAATDDVLHIADDDRYGRLRLIPWWRQDRLAMAKVLVVGAGALGNEVLKNLALVGVGTVVVVDFDEVEPSNLARSVLFRMEDGGKPKAEVAGKRAAELNPDVNIRAIRGDVITDVGLGLFAEMDVVIGCLDNREARLWVNRQCWKVGTPWVDSGIQEINGVVRVFTPPDSACYECGMTSRDYQLLNLRYSCPLLRREDIQAGKVPTAPTIASMMAAMEVQEALKLIHGMPVQAGCLHVFNGVANTFYTTRLTRRDDCLSHETYPEATAIDLGNGATAEEVFHVARPHLSGPLSLTLDRDLVAAIDWPQVGRRHEVMRPRSEVGQGEATDPESGAVGHPELVSAVEEGSDLSRRPLADLGVPPYDIVRVDGTDGSAFLLLAADRSRALPPRSS